MVIQDASGNLYIVTVIDGIDHAWNGTPAKKVSAGFTPKANAKPRLVRKAGCVEVA